MPPFRHTGRSERTPLTQMAPGNRARVPGGAPVARSTAPPPSNTDPHPTSNTRSVRGSGRGVLRRVAAHLAAHVEGRWPGPGRDAASATPWAKPCYAPHPPLPMRPTTAIRTRCLRAAGRRGRDGPRQSDPPRGIRTGRRRDIHAGASRSRREPLGRCVAPLRVRACRHTHATGAPVATDMTKPRGTKSAIRSREWRPWS